MSNVTHVVIALAAVLCFSAASGTDAQRQRRPNQGRPAPDLADVSYGPHERNVLDLWQAESEEPTPLVVFIHGGGFRGGDKRGVPPSLIRTCLEQGISVASINYRLSDTASFPAFMLDGGRAVQFLRHKAAAWNLDPTKVACCGGSAGAGISLWLAFHDDLADPDSEDPVLRQSTRLTAAGSLNGQCSYDPRFIKEHIGGSGRLDPALPPFYGIEPDELDTPKAYKLYDEAAPINYLSEDDPPVFTAYLRSMTPLPLPADADEGLVIHHPQFGVVLKERMEALGIACLLRLPEDYPDAGNDLRGAVHVDMANFFAKCFAAQ